jgi:cellulose synthase/poly-beta-1,6-N-acetylglucosamine synthase-like glycosyltransferase
VDVTVCIGTYGGQEWIELAQRAIASASPQARVVHVHGETLAVARNAALDQVDTEFVVHLDADDELDPGYIATLAEGTADLRVPSVRYIRGGREHAPYVPRVAGHRHDCGPDCLRSGNYIVIGAMVRTALLRGVGGWHDWSLYEDWDAWLRCWRAGATIETIPAAVYRAHVRPDSRNRAPSRELRLAQHHAIHHANFPAGAVG